MIGSISSLIKTPSDIMPYMEMLKKSLKMSVCDNLGDVRAIAAKAYGVLCKKLTLEHCTDLILSLKDILESEESTAVDRAGAA